MSMDIIQTNVVCSRCGISYGRRKGYFPVSYAILHKGIGYIPVCKQCIDDMYNKYLSQCDNAANAVRQMCRKLDLYWNAQLFEDVEKKNTAHSMMTAYIAKLNTGKYVGKCYDDTLAAEGVLWSFGGASRLVSSEPDQPELYDGAEEYKDDYDEPTIEADESIDITDDIIMFWGPGFTVSMYRELEQRRRYWMSKFEDNENLDVGAEALIRQICNLEIAINKDRVAGRSIDKNVNMLNTLLGSLSLKPSQNRDDGDSATESTPLGIWIRRWETQRPIPEVDPELRDVDGIVRYIETWFKGHLSKMLGYKNAVSKMYEDEINKYRVERPSYEEDDDETVFAETFGGDDA